MVSIKLQHLSDGRYVTDPFISKDEWISVLHQAEDTGRSGQIDALLHFLRMSGNKGTCADFAKVNGTNSDSVRSLVTNFGKYVQKALGNRFRMESSESEEKILGRKGRSGRSGRNSQMPFSNTF